MLKKGFLEFGEVHDVFSGKFKKPYNDISNGKFHVRIRPSKTKNDLFMKYYLINLGLFRSWAEIKKLSCKKCMCEHMLQDTSHLAPAKLANEDSTTDKWDIVFVSRAYSKK